MLFFSCCKPIHQPAERPAESQDRESGSIKTLDVDLSRSVKERRILQRAPLQITADGKTCTGSSRSLFEASAYRVATHEERARQQLNQPDEDHQGIPQMFLDAYVSALQEGNTQYVLRCYANCCTCLSQCLTEDHLQVGKCTRSIGFIF